MMTSKSNKSRWGVVALATLTMAAVLASPQAAAHKKKKHAAKKHHSTTSHTYSRHSSYSHSSAGNSRVDALEQRLLSMQAELDALRAQQAGGAATDPQTTAKVQELEQWMADSKAKPAKEKNNMVFFRGNWAHNNNDRKGQILTDAAHGLGLVDQSNGDKDAWGIGAGFDFSLTDNVWGLMPNTEVLAELMFEYKKFDSKDQALNPLQSTVGSAVSGGPKAGAGQVTVSQFTLTAAPKIKFMKGSAFRPWIMPVGLAVHVISPPSNGVTVFNPGAMFGAGADYRIWKDLFVGVDGRYHWTASDADGTKTDGFTLGGYLGIGF